MLIMNELPASIPYGFRVMRCAYSRRSTRCHVSRTRAEGILGNWYPFEGRIKKLFFRAKTHSGVSGRDVARSLHGELDHFFVEYRQTPACPGDRDRSGCWGLPRSGWSSRRRFRDVSIWAWTSSPMTGSYSIRNSVSFSENRRPPRRPRRTGGVFPPGNGPPGTGPRQEGPPPCTRRERRSLESPPGSSRW